MKTRDRMAGLLQWIAWISGSLELLFLLVMVVGHLFGDANGPNAMTFPTTEQALAFAFFPMLSILGLALAYKWELLGGVVVLLSLAGLFALRPDLMKTAFWFWATPAVCYLGHWFLSKQRASRH
ncbi:MAG: hypothetical protein IPO17_17500 [Flavobacteriales bacterium]|nr:hypothetical protein [Flavobacteriales bacterium]MBK9196739.1 hypothetical protein [Flavobacteriales bacterium]